MYDESRTVRAILEKSGDPSFHSVHASSAKGCLLFPARECSHSSGLHPSDILRLIFKLLVCLPLIFSEITLPEHRFCDNLHSGINESCCLDAPFQWTCDDILCRRIQPARTLFLTLPELFHCLFRQNFICPANVLPLFISRRAQMPDEYYSHSLSLSVYR